MKEADSHIRRYFPRKNKLEIIIWRIFH